MDRKHKRQREKSPLESHRKHHRHDRNNRDRPRQGSSGEEEEKKPRVNERKHRDEDNRRPRESNRSNQDEDYDRKPTRRNLDEERESHDDRRTKHHKKKHSHRDRGADYDPNIRIKQEKDDENFQHQQRERTHHDRNRKIDRVKREDGGGDFGMNSAAPVKKEEGDEGGEGEETQEDKEEINMGLTGKLTEDTNTFRGVVIKYNEPPEAMMPRRKWRLYPFKGDESLPVLHIHRQSAFLMGRERKIADIPIDHPSSSKQHAVLQFRAVAYTRPSGAPGRRVRPYIIDLESANGTYLNGDRLEAKRYYELQEKDVIKFGFSTREYVVLHDSVDTSEVEVGEDIEEI